MCENSSLIAMQVQQYPSEWYPQVKSRERRSYRRIARDVNIGPIPQFPCSVD
jgi:hypothetical protein